MRVAQYTLALQHYQGGHPVPLAASLYDGSLQTYANISTNLGLISPLFAYYPIQTTKSQGLQAILILSGSG
jgi:hypothetical protein